MPISRRLVWMVLILLLASLSRLHDLPVVPSGMTHDEADHGLDAWGVVQGERPIYFTVGYGREPLYDYSTAVLMTFMGPSYLAGRLTSIFFSLILIAGTYAWVRQAFDGRAALLTAAGLAFGFWPLMTARQALRSELLPALLVVAVATFWWGLQIGDWRLGARRRALGDWRLEIRDWGFGKSLVSSLQSPFLWAGVLLGLTFYTYIPSRILWLLFPGLGVYCWLVGRRRVWRGVLLTVGVAGIVGAPLLLYLVANPGAEARIEQLALPLQQAARGEFDLLWRNARSGLGILTATGDPQWRYNVADRPLLSLPEGLLFYSGTLYSAWRVALAVRRRRHGAQTAAGHFFALFWLALGMAPVLVTGRELSTTQAIGMQPVLYLFPALALVSAVQFVEQRLEGWRATARRIIWPAAGLSLAAALLVSTWRTYFEVWAPHPEVAVQYEAELVEIVRALNDSIVRERTVAVSTDAPGLFHDPATARMFLENEHVTLQWFDGRHSLLLPGEGEALIVLSDSAPLHPTLTPYLEALHATAADLEAGVAAYKVSHKPARLLQFYPQFSTEINSLSTELSTDIVFGGVVQFLGYELQPAEGGPGEMVRLATVWRVLEPTEDDLIFFTHVRDETGAPLTQADRLDVPTHTWRAGDVFVQLHELALPAELAAGEYGVTVGIYAAADWQQRLPVRTGGEETGDVLLLTPLVVGP